MNSKTNTKHTGHKVFTGLLWVVLGSLPAVSCSSGKWTAPAEAKRPNIIVILSDDIGYSDIGPYGSEIKTPSLDRLASEGIRFTHFYNTARCSPSRAALLTGLYPHQAAMGHLATRPLWDEPGYLDDLNRNTATIAELLREAGYSTYMTGKWHLYGMNASDLPQGPDIDTSNWKLVSKVTTPMEFKPEDENGWELYDLEKDPSETENLAARYPERVKKMAAKWEAEAVRLKAKPWPWEKSLQKSGE